MDSPCATCAAPCCVGRAVALTAADVRRLQVALGLPWSAFATIVGDDDGFQLVAGGPRYGFHLRHGGDGSCVFAVSLATTRRCGVHAVRPLACRVYPWHVALAAPAPNDDLGDAVAAPLVNLALGHDAACPPPLAAAWRARVDVERAALAATIADAVVDSDSDNDSDSDTRARWNDEVARSGRRHVIEDYLAWLERAR